MVMKILGWFGLVVFLAFIALLAATMTIYKISTWWIIGFLVSICLVFSFSFSQWVKFFKFVFSIACIAFVGFALYSASPTNILIGVVAALLYVLVMNRTRGNQ